MPTPSLPQVPASQSTSKHVRHVVGLLAATVLPLLVSAAPAVARYGTERVAAVARPEIFTQLRSGIRPSQEAIQSALSEFSGRLVQGTTRSGEGYIATVVPSGEGWQRARVESTVMSRDGAPLRIESFDIPEGPRVADAGAIRATEDGGVTIERQYRGWGPNGVARPSSLIPERNVVISETYSVGDAALAGGVRITQSVRASEAIMHRTRVDYSLERSADGRSVLFDRQMSLDTAFGGTTYPRRGRVQEALRLELESGTQVVGMSIVPNAEGAVIRVQTVSRSGQGMEHEFSVPRANGKPRLVRSQAHVFDARRSVEPIAANRVVEPDSAARYRGFGGAGFGSAAGGAVQ